VSADIDRLLAPKSFEDLESLEVQVKKKLDSDEPIDYDYWEQLLRSLRVWKAKAKLRKVSQEIINERLQVLRKQQEETAKSVKEKLQTMLSGAEALDGEKPNALAYDPQFDPEPLLKLRAEDKNLVQLDEKKFMDGIVSYLRFPSKSAR
jgi:hypothetical protein